VSLRLRLTLTYLVLTALSIGFLSAVLYNEMRRNLEDEMDRRLQVRSRQVELTIWPGTVSLTPEDLTSSNLNLAPLSRLNAPNVYVQVLSRDGTPIAASENLRGTTLPVDRQSLQRALAGQQVLQDVIIEEDHTIRVLSVPILVDRNAVGVLEVGQSRLPLEETMAGLRTLLQLLGGGALLLSTAIGWLVAHQGLRPLSLISARAATMTAQRDFSKRLDYQGYADEVGQLAGAIDHLLATVDGTLRTHREFLADTSHELRNPLLALRTDLDLLDRIPDPHARAECLQEAREQAARMSRLVTDLLLLAQVESERLIERRPLELASVVATVAQEAEQQADSHTIRVSPLEPVRVVGDEQRLAQVVRNLVDNAVRHTPTGTEIAVSLRRENGWARLDVADTGGGIAPEHVDHLFERFYRAGRHPTGDGGTGLGLAIVKRLTEAHGGEVSVDSVLGEGTRFTVRLPATPQS
jgi:two-component system, OmpR family, sensor kinase